MILEAVKLTVTITLCWVLGCLLEKEMNSSQLVNVSEEPSFNEKDGLALSLRHLYDLIGIVNVH